MLLLVVCAAAFVVLIALTAWRFVAYRRATVEDFLDPRRAFGFFTFVAGTNVLGVRLGMDGHHGTTAALLALSGARLAGARLRRAVDRGARPPDPSRGRHRERHLVHLGRGEPVGRSRGRHASSPSSPTDDASSALLAVVSWSVGVFLYASAGIFVSLRLMLYDFGPDELTPPYWVAMGAMAITVLAGARIVEMADAPMVDATRGLIAGLAVVFWALRHLAHPRPGRGGLVAAREPTDPAALRADAVEHRLPPRHVCRGRDLPR